MLFTNKNLIYVLSVLCTGVAAGVLIHQAIKPPTEQHTPAPPPSYDHLSGSPALSSAISPLPLTIDIDKDKAALGEQLFHDVRLSADNTVSCATCHNLSAGGTIPQPVATGVHGRTGIRNPPTVFNTVFSFTRLWDGRSMTLEEQMNTPILNIIEMGSNWPDLLNKLRQDEGYQKAFRALYGEGISQQDVQDAIATFERSLITPNSRFDQYLRGDTDVLTDDEKAGYQLFDALGCISCHQGMNIGGNLYQKIGIFKPYVSSAPRKEIDFGRFHITGKEADKFVFRVPSLRNVALTAPYFHDGSVATLDEAISLMGEYQLGRKLTDAEISKLRAFLHTLTGEFRGKPL